MSPPGARNGLIINSSAVARSSSEYAGFFRRHAVSRLDSGVSFTKLPKMGRLRESPNCCKSDGVTPSLVPHHSGPLWAHNHVVTLHDCINVEYTYRNDWRLPVFRRMFNLVLANARVVVALSPPPRTQCCGITRSRSRRS